MPIAHTWSNLLTRVMNCECQSLPAVAGVAGTARVLPTSGAMVLLGVESSIVHRQPRPQSTSVNRVTSASATHKGRRKKKREREGEREETRTL